MALCFLQRVSAVCAEVRRSICLKEAITKTSRNGAGSGFGTLHCPTPSCRKALFEMDHSLLQDESEAVTCQKCGTTTKPQLCSFAEDSPSSLMVRLWCPGCKGEVERVLPAIRKYCHSCKEYHIIFFWSLMGVTRFSGSSEEKKLPVPVG